MTKVINVFTLVLIAPNGKEIVFLIPAEVADKVIDLIVPSGYSEECKNYFGVSDEMEIN